MHASASRVVCAGCGHDVPGDDPRPFRCPCADGTDDTDHVLRRLLDLSDRETAAAAAAAFRSPAENPFVRYRPLFRSRHLAAAQGLSDADFIEIVESLDARVARVCGRGFRITPFTHAPQLGRELGFAREDAVRVKDETGNVSGTHKARHLMGLLIWLETVERTGLARHASRLAIASCGNAALAAAILARADDRDLDVFVPPDAHPAIIEELVGLQANVVPCPRDGRGDGDPCLRRFRKEVAGGGALPFCVQGSENGLAIEGGETIAYEMISTLLEAGAALDRIFIQVGGGALASACVQALVEARSLGLVQSLPRIHAVQTEGAAPLRRAYVRVAERLDDDESSGEAARANRILGFPARRIEEELGVAATNRSLFMWPWEEEPRSIAGAILDDETYDWLAVVQGMLLSGGWPVVVGEHLLREANALAHRATGICTCHTGSAGLAGLLALRRSGEVEPDERVAVLFTGVERR